MKQPIRLFLILSASALFATACSNAPYDDGSSTIGTNYSGSANIPEAGPLTSTSNTQVQPQPNYQAPVAYQQPQAPAADQYAYAQPQATPQVTATAQPTYDPYANASSYDTGASNPAPDYAAAPASNGYDYAAGGGNDTYNSYGGSAAPANNYASNTGGDYYSGGGGAAPAANTSGSVGSSGGSAAVQLFASGSSTKANEIMQNMQSRGLQAVVDQADGLYKVRVPFSTESEARANLIRVRSASGESGAFVTYR